MSDQRLPLCLRQTVEERAINGEGFHLAGWWTIAEAQWDKPHKTGVTIVEHVDSLHASGQAFFLIPVKVEAARRADLSAPDTATYRCLYCRDFGFLERTVCGEKHQHSGWCYVREKCNCLCHTTTKRESK